jgi:hypothetical protein
MEIARIVPRRASEPIDASGRPIWESLDERRPVYGPSAPTPKPWRRPLSRIASGSPVQAIRLWAQHLGASTNIPPPVGTVVIVSLHKLGLARE